MKQSTVRLSLLSAALLTAGSLLVASMQEESGHHEQGEHEEHEEHEHTPLGERMESFEEGLEELALALESDESLASALDLVSRLQMNAVEAKSFEPRLVAQITDELERRDRRRDFRLEMQNLIRGLLDVEAALLNADPDALTRALDALHKVERAGHRQFRPRHK